ncbi:MAG: hypothetical protein KDA78_04475 [Planctomycetaceae bacterium]|nr:hypothetical protein [Planctomycetaceae bacterium]
MNTTFTLKKLVTHPYFSMFCVLTLLFILPQYGAMPMMFASAGILTACVAAVPEQFRTRNGSLTMAICLVTAMWVGAAIISVLSLLGEIQG